MSKVTEKKEGPICIRLASGGSFKWSKLEIRELLKEKGG